MSQEAISYLNHNKDKFSKEALIKSLRSSGYLESDIETSITTVYGKKEQINSFSSDFDPSKGASLQPKNNQRMYLNDTDKAKDLFLGLFFGVIFAIIPIIGWFLGIFFLVRYYNRYRWQFYGIIAGFILVYSGLFFVFT